MCYSSQCNKQSEELLDSSYQQLVFLSLGAMFSGCFFAISQGNFPSGSRLGKDYPQLILLNQTQLPLRCCFFSKRSSKKITKVYETVELFQENNKHSKKDHGAIHGKSGSLQTWRMARCLEPGKDATHVFIWYMLHGYMDIRIYVRSLHTVQPNDTDFMSKKQISFGYRCTRGLLQVLL